MFGRTRYLLIALAAVLLAVPAMGQEDAAQVEDQAVVPLGEGDKAIDQGLPTVLRRISHADLLPLYGLDTASAR